MKRFRIWVGIAALLIFCWLLWHRAGREHAPGNKFSAGEGQHTGQNQAAGPSTPPTPAPPIAPAFPTDSRTSSHPVERAVALGAVLDVRVEPGGSLGQWTRIRLVQTEIQPRPVRVVEQWTEKAANGSWVCVGRDMFLADQLIIKARPQVAEARLGERLAQLGMRLERALGGGVFAVRLPEAKIDTTAAALRVLSSHRDLIESAEPDGVGFGAGIPNDSNFADQWALHNTGQSGGVADADVDAPEFWDIIESAPGVVIALLDSGLNLTHPDLQGVAWVNPGEIPGDGIDNEGDGKVDDVNGWDFVNNDNNPTDDHGHGSNITGIITANRNNAQGIAGMLSGVSILVCKILDSSNSGLTSNLIAATTYARLRGVSVMNLSLGNYPFSSTLSTEFTACDSAGIVLSTSAGNQGVNNDTTPNYPSSYTHANIIAVANHDRSDVRWAGSFNPSNYGLVSVDLFAPGSEILSPILGTSYSFYTGTSQAAPFVTAVAAAIKYVRPSWRAPQIKSSILASVIQLPTYNGLCSTGGRLNAVTAIANAIRQSPSLDADGDGFPDLFEYLAGTRVDSKGGRPAVVSEVVGGFLRLGVPRLARPEAHFVVETSTDLLSWSTTGVSDFSSASQLLGGIFISNASRGFLRIKPLSTP